MTANYRVNGKIVGTMEFREDLSFQLEGLCPAQLCVLPAQSCLVVVGSAGEMRSLDLSSGRQLDSTGRPRASCFDFHKRSLYFS